MLHVLFLCLPMCRLHKHAELCDEIDLIIWFKRGRYSYRQKLLCPVPSSLWALTPHGAAVVPVCPAVSHLFVLSVRKKADGWKASSMTLGRDWWMLSPGGSSRTWGRSVLQPHSAPCSAYCSHPGECGSFPGACSGSLTTLTWKKKQCVNTEAFDLFVLIPGGTSGNVLPWENRCDTSTGMKQHHLQLLNLWRRFVSFINHEPF